jgi:hypothetical protein
VSRSSRRERRRIRSPRQVGSRAQRITAIDKNLRLYLADAILRRLARADARSKPRLLAAYRLLVGNQTKLLRLAQAEKRSGRPKGPRAATRFSRWVWLARHYGIPFSAIENAVNRDPKWVRTRVKQTEASIASGQFMRAQGFSYDNLTPQERRQRILAKLEMLARTGART